MKDKSHLTTTYDAYNTARILDDYVNGSGGFTEVFAESFSLEEARVVCKFFYHSLIYYGGKEVGIDGRNEYYVGVCKKIRPKHHAMQVADCATYNGNKEEIPYHPEEYAVSRFLVRWLKTASMSEQKKFFHFFREDTHNMLQSYFVELAIKMCLYWHARLPELKPLIKSIVDAGHYINTRDLHY